MENEKSQWLSGTVRTFAILIWSIFASNENTSTGVSDPLNHDTRSSIPLNPGGSKYG